jgi:CheY-like chemotaxis protein
MRLEDITGKVLSQALAIYCQNAWPKAAERQILDLTAWDENVSGEELLARLNDESARTEGMDHRRYTIRAGNERYPFMKLGVEEWIRRGEFFLYVATHDEMELPEDDPDYGAWQKLRHHNARLKRKIEAAWHTAGLPTLKDTKTMCPFTPGEKIAIIGENTGYEAETLAAMLGEQGYNTTITASADYFLKQVRKCHPDIAVLNSFVGEVPGHVIAETLRKDAETSNIPIMLIISPFDRLDHSLEATTVLAKPVTTEGLKRALDDIRNAAPSQR